MQMTKVLVWLVVPWLATACGGEDPAPPPGAGGMAMAPAPTADQTPMPTTMEPSPMPTADDPPPAAGYAALVEPIFATRCLMACHDATGGLGGPNTPDSFSSKLNLDMGVGYTELTTTMSLQSTMPFVTPGDRNNSYLYLKITGAQADAPTQETSQQAGNGLKMPYTPVGGDITPDEIETVGAWIDSGAAP